MTYGLDRLRACQVLSCFSCAFVDIAFGDVRAPRALRLGIDLGTTTAPWPTWTRAEGDPAVNI